MTNMKRMMAVSALFGVSAVAGAQLREFPGDCFYEDQSNVLHKKDCGKGVCCMGFYSGDGPGGHEPGDLAVMECCPPGTTCNFFSLVPEGTLLVECDSNPPVDPDDLGG